MAETHKPLRKSGTANAGGETLQERAKSLFRACRLVELLDVMNDVSVTTKVEDVFLNAQDARVYFISRAIPSASAACRESPHDADSLLLFALIGRKSQEMCRSNDLDMPSVRTEYMAEPRKALERARFLYELQGKPVREAVVRAFLADSEDAFRKKKFPDVEIIDSTPGRTSKKMQLLIIRPSPESPKFDADAIRLLGFTQAELDGSRGRAKRLATAERLVECAEALQSNDPLTAFECATCAEQLHRQSHPTTDAMDRVCGRAESVNTAVAPILAAELIKAVGSCAKDVHATHRASKFISP